jgi:hypothetical protein
MRIYVDYKHAHGITCDKVFMSEVVNVKPLRNSETMFEKLKV